MNLRRYRELCIKAVTNQLDEIEKATLNSWLAESESNRAEFENIKIIWNITSPEEVPQIPDVNAAWVNLNNRIESLEKTAKKKSLFERAIKYFQSSLKPNLRPAFVSVLIVVIMLGVLFLWNNDTTGPGWKSITTANKERREVKLPDGSIVCLNSSSSIRFNETFDGDFREVKLDGEAFFSVTKSSRPFVVVTGNAKTTVLGTKFNVWARDEQTRVIVKEGLVKLASIRSVNDGVNLPPNHSGSVIKDQKPSSPSFVNSDQLIGWINNELVFDRTPLSEITSELQRYYDTRIEIEDKKLCSLSLTGTFKNAELDSALTMICLALDIIYEKNQNGFLIKEKHIAEKK
ncbi:MAG: FecR domain-containing protein [bacterium]